MKKRISFILAVIMIMAVMIPAIPVSANTTENMFNVSDYDNTEEFYINTVDDFKAFCLSGKKFEGKTVKLRQDITLNDTTATDWYNATGVYTFTQEINVEFAGIFDGQGYAIKGLCIKNNNNYSNWRKSVGLFSSAIKYAVIKDFIMDGFYVESNGATATAAVVGGMNNGDTNIYGVTVKNGVVVANDSVSYSNGFIPASIGALVGWSHLDTSSAADGAADYCKIDILDCVVENSVKVIGDDSVYVGGIGGTIFHNKAHLEINMTGSAIRTQTSDGSYPDAFGYVNADSRGFNARFINYATGYYVWNNIQQITDDTPVVNELMLASGAYGANAAPVVKFVGTQTRATDNAVRFIGLIKKPANDDLSLISSLGFKITVGDTTVDESVIKCNKVYNSIKEDGETKNAPDGYYYFTFVISEVADGTTFNVEARTTVNGSTCYTNVGSYTYTPEA